MKRPTEQQILDFLSGEADPATVEQVLHALESSPELAAEVRTAAAGMEAAMSGAGALAGLAGAEDGPDRAAAPGGVVDGGARSRSGAARRVPAWWLPLAAAAGMALAFPLAPRLAGVPDPGDPAPTAVATGEPTDAEPSFVITLHGRWPDASQVGRDETERRAAEYWGFATRLADEGRLVAAGDLRWEPGLRLAAGGRPVSTEPTDVAEPDFLVGMFAIRANSYEEALAIAEACPHLQYGGSVSVRQVSRGFVTVPGMDDWAG